MVDFWFRYYKKKFLRTGRAMCYILFDAEMNPFCDDEVIERLCDWLDEDTNLRYSKKQRVPCGNSYNKYKEIIGE